MGDGNLKKATELAHLLRSLMHQSEHHHLQALLVPLLGHLDLLQFQESPQQKPQAESDQLQLETTSWVLLWLVKARGLAKRGPVQAYPILIQLLQNQAYTQE